MAKVVGLIVPWIVMCWRPACRVTPIRIALKGYYVNKVAQEVFTDDCANRCEEPQVDRIAWTKEAQNGCASYYVGWIVPEVQSLETETRMITKNYFNSLMQHTKGNRRNIRNTKKQPSNRIEWNRTGALWRIVCWAGSIYDELHADWAVNLRVMVWGIVVYGHNSFRGGYGM